MFFIGSSSTYPYNFKVAGNGNAEASTGFGAIRTDANQTTFTGDVALIGDARLFGSAVYTGTISNECATAKTLTFGGTYATGAWTINMDGRLTDGNAPLSLTLDRSNATLNFGGEDHCISGALTTLAGTVNVTAGRTQVGDISNATAITVADGATLLTSGIGTGAGSYTFDAGSALGFACVMGETDPSLPHLAAQTLTFAPTAKITVTGIELIDKDNRFHHVPIFTFPSAAITGVPELTEPLMNAWGIARQDNGDNTSTLFLTKRTGTIIILR